MNTEIIGSQHVQCEQCGGRDFRLEDGYYYCLECQLQTQEYQEHVMDNEYGGAFTRSKKIIECNSEAGKSQSQDDSRSVKGSTSITSWEILNYVLKGLVDELILLGAPKSLKPITLQLWATYLSRSEIAFTSTSLETKPKFGIYHRQSDAQFFYKSACSSVRNFRVLMRKRTSRKTRKGATVRSKKLRLTLDKKALAKEVYDNESIASSSFADSQSSINLSSLSASLASLGPQTPSKPSKSERFSYSRKGKSDVDEFLAELTDNEENAVEFHRKYMKRAKDSVHHATLLRIITILRIALLLCGSNIHLGDLRRWMGEGYFSLDCTQKFIPHGVDLLRGQLNVLYEAASYRPVASMTKQMVALLSVSKDFPSPNYIINTLVKRYCIMLNLPETICIGIEKLLKIKPAKASLMSPKDANFEAKAMAYILFSLKVLIGLDDVTEYVYVPSVKKSDNYFEELFRRDGTEGVKWEEWCRQYIARMAEKALNHHPTLCRLYPNSYIGRDHSLLSHWDSSIGKANPQMSYPDMSREVRDSIHQILRPLVCSLPEPSWKPGLESEATRTGPPLAVLSEPRLGQHKSGLVLVDRYMKQKMIIKSPQDIEVQLDDEQRAPSGIEPIALYHVDKSRGTIACDRWPDFNIWCYHSGHFSGMRIEKFDRVIEEKLPFSFVWLLGEMAAMIHQSKKDIYLQLDLIERMFCKLKKPSKRKKMNCQEGSA